MQKNPHESVSRRPTQQQKKVVKRHGHAIQQDKICAVNVRKDAHLFTDQANENDITLTYYSSVWRLKGMICMWLKPSPCMCPDSICSPASPEFCTREKWMSHVNESLPPTQGLRVEFQILGFGLDQLRPLQPFTEETRNGTSPSCLACFVTLPFK